MSANGPFVVILAGPNGAGKSTSAPAFLQGTLGVREFVNADVIARGLSGFGADSVAIQAGRVLLERIRGLARQRVSFAFETTLASRSLAARVEELRASGYSIHLVFLSLSSADAAVERVAQRVRSGGHDVPEATVRRRYERGLRNFFVYHSVVDTWRLYDNSDRSGPELIASCCTKGEARVHRPQTWDRFRQEYDRG